MYINTLVYYTHKTHPVLRNVFMYYTRTANSYHHMIGNYIKFTLKFMAFRPIIYTWYWKISRSIILQCFQISQIVRINVIYFFHNDDFGHVSSIISHILFWTCRILQSNFKKIWCKFTSYYNSFRLNKFYPMYIFVPGYICEFILNFHTYDQSRMRTKFRHLHKFVTGRPPPKGTIVCDLNDNKIHVFNGRCACLRPLVAIRVLMSRPAYLTAIDHDTWHHTDCQQPRNINTHSAEAHLQEEVVTPPTPGNARAILYMCKTLTNREGGSTSNFGWILK